MNSKIKEIVVVKVFILILAVITFLLIDFVFNYFINKYHEVPIGKSVIVKIEIAGWGKRFYKCHQYYWEENKSEGVSSLCKQI